MPRVRASDFPFLGIHCACVVALEAHLQMLLFNQTVCYIATLHVVAFCIARVGKRVLRTRGVSTQFCLLNSLTKTYFQTWRLLAERVTLTQLLLPARGRKPI